MPTDLVSQQMRIRVLSIVFLGSLEPTLLDTCQNGTLKSRPLTQSWLESPKVPRVLPNCTFKFCARVAEPYINPGCESGLEVDIIKVLQHKLQFKVKLSDLKSNEMNFFN